MNFNKISKRKYELIKTRATDYARSEDDEPTVIPIDPGQLMSSMFSKSDDIKTDGNKIYFYKDISVDTVLKLNTTLSEMAKKLTHTSLYLNFNQSIPIYLFIHSNGGDAFAGLSAMDHIASLPVPVYTVIDGMCASAATFLSVAGKKRYIMPHSTVLIHQLRTWFAGTFEEMKDDMKNTEKIMDIIKNVYKEKTTIPLNKLEELLTRELYMASDECLRYNIADDYYNPNNNDINEPKKSAPKRRKRVVE